jgi:uncharacterized protein YifE (UPF0438 family)
MLSERRQCDRELLRLAGEHLGMLAEQQKEVYDFYTGNRRAGTTRKQFWDRYAKLARLSKEILELASDK